MNFFFDLLVIEEMNGINILKNNFCGFAMNLKYN